MMPSADRRRPWPEQIRARGNSLSFFLGTDLKIGGIGGSQIINLRIRKFRDGEEKEGRRTEAQAHLEQEEGTSERQKP